MTDTNSNRRVLPRIQIGDNSSLLRLTQYHYSCPPGESCKGIYGLPQSFVLAYFFSTIATTQDQFHAPRGAKPTEINLNLILNLDPDLLGFDFNFADLSYDMNLNLNRNPIVPSPASTTTPKPITELDQQKPKRPPASNLRWCPAYLHALTHSRRPSNLPPSVEYTDTTEIQNIPTELFVPEFTTVAGYGVDGQVVEVSVGSRMRRGCGGDGAVLEGTPFMLSVVDAGGTKTHDMAWSRDLG